MQEGTSSPDIRKQLDRADARNRAQDRNQRQDIIDGLNKPGLIDRVKKLFSGKLTNTGTAAVITGAGVVGGAAVATEMTQHPIENTVNAAVNTVQQGSQEAQQVADQITDVKNFAELGKNPAKGQYLKRQEDGTYVISDQPEILSVGFVPLNDPAKPHLNRDTILVRNEAGNGGNEIELKPQDMGTSYAEPVFGDAFGDGQLPNKYSRFEVNLDGTQATGGLWFKLVNHEGKPTGPQGKVLGPEEKPFYVAASQVNVVKVPEGTNPDVGVY